MAVDQSPSWAQLEDYLRHPHTLSLHPTTVFISGFLFVLAAYCLHRRLDYFPLMSLTDLIWNAFVYAVPSSLVVALDGRAAASLEQETGASVFYSSSRTFAAKSEAIRRILGLEGVGLMTRLQRARTLSGVGSFLKGHPPFALPGLGNLDNSCYQNSIIQALAALPSLPSFLKSMGGNNECDRDSSMTTALGEIICELNDPENSGQRLWTPAVLKNMSSWTQQDAQEYFSKVVDDLEKEVVRDMKKRQISQGLCEAEAIQNTRGHRLISQDCPEHHFQNPLEGLLAQRVGCLRCGYVEGLSLIPFNCITLPLENSFKMSYRIAECLDNYTDLDKIEGVDCGRCTLLEQKEKLAKVLVNMQATATEDILESVRLRLEAVEDALRCEDFSENTIGKKCQIPKKNRVSSTKSRQAVIARCPDSLVLHVNRSVFDETTFAMTKNNARVTFPSVLDLSDWCLGRTEHNQKEQLEGWSVDPNVSLLAGEFQQADVSSEISSKGMKYHLCAIIIHQGRHENGHYVCYRRDPVDPEHWWRLSDENVYQVSKDQVLAADDVYMLFYERAWVGQGGFLDTSEPAPSSITASPRPADTTTDISVDHEPNAAVGALKENLAGTLSPNVPLPLAAEPEARPDLHDLPVTPKRPEAQTVNTVEDERESPQNDESSLAETKSMVPTMRTAGARKKRSKKAKQRTMPGMSSMVAAN